MRLKNTNTGELNMSIYIDAKPVIESVTTDEFFGYFDRASIPHNVLTALGYTDAPDEVEYRAIYDYRITSDHEIEITHYTIYLLGVKTGDYTDTLKVNEFNMIDKVKEPVRYYIEIDGCDDTDLQEDLLNRADTYELEADYTSGLIDAAMDRLGDR